MSSNFTNYDGTTMKQAIQWQSIHNLLLLHNVQKMSTTNHEVVWLCVTNFQTWRTKCGLLNWLACDHIALLVFTSNKMSPSVCLNYCDKACGHQNKMPGWNTSKQMNRTSRTHRNILDNLVSQKGLITQAKCKLESVQWVRSDWFFFCYKSSSFCSVHWALH